MGGISFSDETFFNYCILALYISCLPTFIALRFLQAPYGKHKRPGWGPTVSAPIAWFVMESPTLWLTAALYPIGNHRLNPKSILLISPFVIHYLHRTIIYPLRLRRTSDKIGDVFPVSVAAIAFAFNLLNAYVQSRWVSHYKSDYEDGRWFWWRFGLGLAVFVTGMWINVWSDRALVRMKKESIGIGGGGGGGYVVPKGGWFEVVSCPNYFGEMVEWFGWAVMMWSWAGFGFFLYTCANLVPRARANHCWYLYKYKDVYPKNRKAVVPFIY